MALQHHAGITLLDCSSRYLTAPVGYADQPPFANAVARLSTRLAPWVLLRVLQWIEHRQGRVRSGNQNAPRTLDLDLLLYADRVIRTDTLIVPHPRMHLRRFVLQPLVEIAPDVLIPGKGRARQLLAAAQDQQCEYLGNL